MYVGNGQLINAPDEGQPVQLALITKWQGKITAMRRPTAAANPDAPVAAQA